MERDLPVPLVLLLTAMVLALFTLLFSFWTAFSPLAFPQFVFCVVVLIYLPGKLLLDSGRVCVRLLEELTLSLVLGMTASSLVYRISTFFGLQRLFLLWSVTAQVVAVSRRRDSWRGIWPSSVLPARKRKCSVRAGCAACSIPRHSCPCCPMSSASTGSMPSGQGPFSTLSSPSGQKRPQCTMPIDRHYAKLLLLRPGCMI